jgi:hypothetical protein
VQVWGREGGGGDGACVRVWWCGWGCGWGCGCGWVGGTHLTASATAASWGMASTAASPAMRCEPRVPGPAVRRTPACRRATSRERGTSPSSSPSPLASPSPSSPPPCPPLPSRPAGSCRAAARPSSRAASATRRLVFALLGRGRCSGRSAADAYPSASLREVGVQVSGYGTVPLNRRVPNASLGDPRGPQGRLSTVNGDGDCQLSTGRSCTKPVAGRK